MASDARALNLREEEKELDDKLMELGLLEPGMTIQEKRELASVVLESTRMAEEQRNQRKSEDEWESMILEPETTGVKGDTSRSESPELIEISISKAEPGKQSTSGTGNQRRRDDCVPTQKGTSMKGRNRTEKESRERKGKREREEDKGELIVLELDDDEGEEVLGGREGMDGRRVEPRTENASRMWNFSRRKKEEDREKECDTERPQKKLSVREEPKDSRGKREVEEVKERKEDEGKGDRPMGEKRGRREVDALPQDSGQKGSPKVVSALDEKTMAVPKAAGTSFYGPSCSTNAKELNPLRSELHGYSRKRGPPRSPQVSLLQLAKEDVPRRKKSLDEAEIEELVLDDETSNEKNKGDETFIKASKESKPSTEKRDDEDRRLFLEKHMGVRKALQEPGKSSDSIMNDDDDWESQPGGSFWIKETKKKNGAGDGPSELREGAFRSVRGSSARTMSLWGGAGKMKRKEQDVPTEIEEGNEVEEDDEDERGGGEPNANGRSPLSDFLVEGKKKRRLAKGSSSKKWVDVVIFPDASCPKVPVDSAKEATKSSKKILLPPNKRWRRVKRKVKSSFGSGSEVDEWISSEEEQPQGKTLTKEQLVARFDKQLDCLKVALKEEEMKNASSRNKYSRCKLCERKSNFKVPPGFQEPDSDDEWNLWKICFFKPPPESSGEKLKLNPKKEKLKLDATPLTFRSAVTRSKTKQLESFRSTRSSSKSPASFEDDASTSPPEAPPDTQGKAPIMDIVPGVDISIGEKSPLVGEVVLFDKVIEPRPCVTTGTQTTWEDEGNSSASGSQGDSVVSAPKSKGVSKVAEPVWDLLELNSDGEEVGSKSVGGSERVMEVSKNVTVRRVRSESPEYLPSEDIPPSPVNVDSIESTSRTSTSFRSEPVAVPSPVISRGPRRGKLRVVDEGRDDHSVKTESVPPQGRKADVHVSEDEGIEEVPEPEPASEREDVSEGIPCPICSCVFPMSEIEAHASECDQEEEDPLPKVLRDGGRRRQREDMGASEVAGVSHQQFDLEMRECAEEMDYEDEYEAACSSQEHAPRPAPLSTYVPISQQKDSLIDYSDQFPHTGSNVNLQATLERMRQSLLKRVRKKTRWRKKRKPKWRGKKF